MTEQEQKIDEIIGEYQKCRTGYNHWCMEYSESFQAMTELADWVRGECDSKIVAKNRYIKELKSMINSGKKLQIIDT